MISAILLLAVALGLSAFFSGSETGMYRVSRIRMVLDALAGSWPARGSVWLLNHSAVFIATVLVGNNLANYLASLAIVLGVKAIFSGGATAELLGTIFMTPVIFVLGELLPKFLFYHAPYRLLSITRPVMLFFTVLFLPVSLLLGLLARVLRHITGETPFHVRLGMARRELEQVLREGHEAGILAGSQRTLAQNVFEIGNQPAIRFGVPIARLASVEESADRDTARAAARRQGHPIVLVRHNNAVEGFLLYADLLNKNHTPQPVPVVKAKASAKHLAVLMRLYEADSEVAVLTDKDGQVRSVVTRRQLLLPLLTAPTP